ncbi:MAG: BREX-4 system phosphatase PglZ, partial [Candidatus Pacebacteria bacterium]|nr:BREX-4 system phosphatase PglZ [Candidatus Paceibacterota bacterium]
MSDTIAGIGKYLSGTSQYPLLVVVSTEEYRDVLNVYSSMPRIKVSDYCIGPDKDPDVGKLEEDLRAYEGSCLLLGLGDYIASKGVAGKNLLTPYKTMILRLGSQVVVLLPPQMYSIVKEVISTDVRTSCRIVLPKNTPEIVVRDSNEFIYGIKAYLDACEKGELIGKVKTERKISNVVIISPESAFDELRYRFPSVFSKLSIFNGTSDNWGTLLTEINNSKKNIHQYLAGQEFQSKEYIFLKHAKSSDYKSWLFFIWLKLQSNGQNYLDLVVSKSNTLGDLFEAAKTAILDIDVSDSKFFKFYEQRKTLLKDCSDADMANFIPRIHIRGAKRIAYLTDNTKVEKQAIIVSLGEGAEADYIKITYPDLYAYLRDYHFDNERLTAYFAAYKKCKVYNKIDAEFEKNVADNAVNRPYNILPSRTSAFSSFKPDNTLLIFLDAMGAEFLGFIKEVCAELKLRFVPRIARANLPTTTTLNREFFDDWPGNKEIPIKDLDELKHHPERGYDYNKSPYPIHLSEELDVVRTALERAAINLQSGEYRKVIIASDHGASRLAVISPDVQIDCSTCMPKSSGRYCQGDSLPVAENIAVENGYAVLADYSRFSGSRAASVEVHGGATLEEVIVPIIELTLVDSNIQVTLENSLIEISFNKTPELILMIMPECDAITVSINGITYKA